MNIAVTMAGQIATVLVMVCIAIWFLFNHLDEDSTLDLRKKWLLFTVLLTPIVIGAGRTWGWW